MPTLRLNSYQLNAVGHASKPDPTRATVTCILNLLKHATISKN